MVKKSKEKLRIAAVVRRFEDKKKLRKYRVTKGPHRRTDVGRYEKIHRVEDLDTGKRYKTTLSYGPLGGTFLTVERFAKRKRRRKM